MSPFLFKLLNKLRLVLVVLDQAVFFIQQHSTNKLAIIVNFFLAILHDILSKIMRTGRNDFSMGLSKEGFLFQEKGFPQIPKIL